MGNLPSLLLGLSTRQACAQAAHPTIPALPVWDKRKRPTAVTFPCNFRTLVLSVHKR